MARRGAGRLAAGQPSGSASAAFRQAVDQARTGPPRAPEPSAEWVRVDDVRDEASGAVRRGRAPTRAARPGPAPAADELADQLRKGVPAAERDKVSRRLDDAARLFAAERYAEAARILRSVTERAPGLAPARELYGLVLYRQGRWKVAAAELEAFRALTGSTEQHPVLADCYRALRRWSLVEELWDELRVASPGAELVTEGRIVAAGALADQGDLPRAIRLLGADWRFPKRAAEHHLRRAYALADLEERAGDLPRARELFGRVHGVDPGFADVASRLRALR